VSSIIHYIYSSRALHPFTTGELGVLLEKARVNNARMGVSGMLLYADGTFFQVLEGEPEAVNAVFDRIGRDPRHDQVTKIINEVIPRRAFGDWTMGFAHASADEVDHLPGLNDFFGEGSILTRVDTGRARKLLNAFAAGRWRARLGPPTPAPAMAAQ